MKVISKPKTRYDDTDLLVWVGNQIEKVADLLDKGLDSHCVYEVAPKAVKRLRRLASQLPPCSPERFAKAIGGALSRRRVPGRKRNGKS